jgi:hypothetical protein
VLLEDTLTAGCAGALALEAERLRLERRLGELAGEIAAGAADRGTQRELASLGERLLGADARLEELRALLAEARVRVSDLRAVVAAS